MSLFDVVLSKKIAADQLINALYKEEPFCSAENRQNPAYVISYLLTEIQQLPKKDTKKKPLFEKIYPYILSSSQQFNKEQCLSSIENISNIITGKETDKVLINSVKCLFTQLKAQGPLDIQEMNTVLQSLKRLYQNKCKVPVDGEAIIERVFDLMEQSTSANTIMTCSILEALGKLADFKIITVRAYHVDSIMDNIRANLRWLTAKNVVSIFTGLIGLIENEMLTSIQTSDVPLLVNRFKQVIAEAGAFELSRLMFSLARLVELKQLNEIRMKDIGQVMGYFIRLKHLPPFEISLATSALAKLVENEVLDMVNEDHLMILLDKFDLTIARPHQIRKLLQSVAQVVSSDEDPVRFKVLLSAMPRYINQINKIKDIGPTILVDSLWGIAILANKFDAFNSGAFDSHIRPQILQILSKVKFSMNRELSDEQQHRLVDSCRMLGVSNKNIQALSKTLQAKDRQEKLANAKPQSRQPSFFPPSEQSSQQWFETYAAALASGC